MGTFDQEKLQIAVRILKIEILIIILYGLLIFKQQQIRDININQIYKKLIKAQVNNNIIITHIQSTTNAKMGFKMRHYRALLKKNWIVWKRTISSSLCELFCPVALFMILLIARALVSKDTISAQSNMDKTVFLSPVDYLQVSNDTTTAFAYGYLQYNQFLNFSNIRIENASHLTRFLPYGCLEGEQELKRPIIAFSGKKSLTAKVVQNIKDVQRWQLVLAGMQVNSTQDAQQKMLYELILKAAKNIQFVEFNSLDSIMGYIQSDSYMLQDDHPGVCFGFSITENSVSDYSVNLIFNDRREQAAGRMIPYLPPVNRFTSKADLTSFNLITQQGFADLQNWIANEILREKTGVANASIAATIVPFYTDSYISDDFETLMGNMLGLFLLLVYVPPVYRLIFNIVSEKESRVRESMKMMGLSDASYWAAWFTYYLAVTTVITCFVLIILYINVFEHSEPGWIFLYLWLFGISLFGFSVLITAFFSHARTAAISGTLLYFGSYFIDFIIILDTRVSLKRGLSMFTTIAISRAKDNIGLFESSGIGVNSDTIWESYNYYRIVDCYYMMAISFVVTFLLGLYIENILPSNYGIRQPFYFCLTRVYWRGRHARRSGQVKIRKGTAANDIESNHHEVDRNDKLEDSASKIMNETQSSGYFEPPSREMIQQDQEGKVMSIKNLKKVFENGFKAVENLNVKMYNNQIFALLGHNGAGKTTTISMLTGLIESSSGDVDVFGCNLFEEMNSVRNFLGVCPQHDVLFDYLSPEEHLDIFCDFKGVNKKEKAAEIAKMIVDVDLVINRETIAKNLSGGNRRKLSVAIALIGGSKLVILDEPTSGMDLSVRRKLWNMLKSYKNNRIVILTTHYMDEADILGDRIGIMTHGKLVCSGSSLFLKNKFGVGYNLAMVKADKTEQTGKKVYDYLLDKIGPEVKKMSEVSSEIMFQVPSHLSYKFKDFFLQFDQQLERLGVKSYGISVTTLEEVFLRVGHLDNLGQEDIPTNNKMKSLQGEEKQASPEVSSRDHIINPTKHMDKIADDESKKDVNLLINEDDEALQDYSIAEQHETGRCNVFMIHLNAIFRKRFNIYKRNIKQLLIEIFVPILLVVIGLGFQQIIQYINTPWRELEPNIYPYQQRILVNDDFTIRTAGQTLKTKDFMDNLPLGGSKDWFSETYKNYSAALYNNNQSRILPAFDFDVFQQRGNGSVKPLRYGSYFLYQADRKRMDFKFAAFVNTTSPFAAAYIPQFMYESVLKVATNNTNFKLKVTNSPFPVTKELKQRKKMQNSVLVVFVVAVGFALIPASIISNMVSERQLNLKHMQMISGMNLPAYWIANAVFDLAKAYVPCIVSIGLLYAFDIQYDYVWILFLLYPLGVIPYTYFMSFLISTENLAQTVTIFLHFVISGIGCSIAAVMRVIDSTYGVGDVLSWVFQLVPSASLTNSIIFAASRDNVFFLRPDIAAPDFDLQYQGGYILIILMHGVVWTIACILIETGSLNWAFNLYYRLQRSNIGANLALKYDEDVLEEERRVQAMDKEALQVRVNKFRKVYTSFTRKPFLAVEKTSFGLEYGECFALLGVNGAGKTTTFKSLTGEISATSGEVTVNGMDIQRNFDKVRKLIGYCPQHDCIFPLMSVEEHLWYYARLKGIKKELRAPLIEKEIQQMNLTEHRHKPAGTLSGGNKRKLSVAICVLGNPPIILLDEPSAGMDPEARRFMWSVVAKISQQRKKSAVILTTHSMEEAEALSTKMGIMVKGGIFRCFGSSQHIKGKFGTGYEVEVKIQKLTSDQIQSLLSKYGLENQAEGTIEFPQLASYLKNHEHSALLTKELRKGGLGNELVLECEDTKGLVKATNFVNWVYVEEQGLKIVQGLAKEFQECEVLEHYNDYFKLRVPKGSKSIGYIFNFIENNKESLCVNEYSAQQTTLEQIFQTFANQSVAPQQQIDQEEGKQTKSKKVQDESIIGLAHERLVFHVDQSGNLVQKGADQAKNEQINNLSNFTIQ